MGWGQDKGRQWGPRVWRARVWGGGGAPHLRVSPVTPNKCQTRDDHGLSAQQVFMGLCGVGSGAGAGSLGQPHSCHGIGFRSSLGGSHCSFVRSSIHPSIYPSSLGFPWMEYHFFWLSTFLPGPFQRVGGAFSGFPRRRSQEASGCLMSYLHEGFGSTSGSI